MLNKITIDDIEVSKKKVFLRVDLNVPLGKLRAVTDTSRVVKILPTLENLLRRKAKVFIFSHLGRPQAPHKKFSLLPLKILLERELGMEVPFCHLLFSQEMEDIVNNLPFGNCALMENIRFYKEEKNNDINFARRIAGYFDIYVTDAFASIHNKDSSICTIPRYLAPRAYGYLIKKEFEYLQTKLLDKPKKPLAIILGGAKVSDKIKIFRKLLMKTDAFLVGGAMAYPFLRSQGIEIGKSPVNKKDVSLATQILQEVEKMKKLFYLPLDHVCVSNLEEGKKNKFLCTLDVHIPDNHIGLDIGKKTIQKFREVINKFQTIFWNGPMGRFELEPFKKGTKEIAKSLSQSKGISIIGGGDSAAAIDQCKLQDKITHISTGGGASLKLIAGEVLPGIEVLQNKK